MAAAIVSATKRVAVSARRRLAWHQQRVQAAVTWRETLWRLTGWIIAETKELSELDRAGVVSRLAEIARDLNTRNGGSS